MARKPQGDVRRVADEILTNLKKEVAESYNKKYQELNDIWVELERKAQWTIVLSGIFLSGSFAFVRHMKEQIPPYEKLLLTLSLLVLLLALFYALRVLRVRRVFFAPTGKSIDKFLNDMEEKYITQQILPSEIPKREPRVFQDQIGLWRKTVENMERQREEKAKFLMAAQSLVTGAIVIGVSLTIAQIFQPEEFFCLPRREILFVASAGVPVALLAVSVEFDWTEEQEKKVQTLLWVTTILSGFLMLMPFF